MDKSARPHFNSVFDLKIDNSHTFVISGKITSLQKVIKYVKRSKYSFNDFSAKHTPSATLIFFYVFSASVNMFDNSVNISDIVIDLKR